MSPSRGQELRAKPVRGRRCPATVSSGPPGVGTGGARSPACVPASQPSRKGAGPAQENAKPLPTEAGAFCFERRCASSVSGQNGQEVHRMKYTRLWVMSLLVAAMVMVLGCGGNDEGSGGATQTAVRTQASVAASPFAAFDCNAAYPATKPGASAIPLSEKDDTGATLSFAAPPSKIISLSAAHVEVLYAIGAGGQLLAGDKFSDCPKAAAALEHVDSFAPSVEAITALQPDLVLLAFPNPDLQQALSNVGVKSILVGIPESVDGA